MLTPHDPESWLSTIWDALHGYREDCISEGDEVHDAEWNDICTAMAWVREGLGLPSETDDDLHEANAGERCTACGRDGLECSRAPCPAVIADREA